MLVELLLVFRFEAPGARARRSDQPSVQKQAVLVFGERIPERPRAIGGAPCLVIDSGDFRRGVAFMRIALRRRNA